MNTQLEVVYKRLYPQARRVVATSTLSRHPDVYLARMRYTVLIGDRTVYSGGDYEKASAIYEKHFVLTLKNTTGEFVELRRDNGAG